MDEELRRRMLSTYDYREEVRNKELDIIPEKDIIRERWMTEITIYPNGMKFIKSYFVGKDKVVPKRRTTKTKEHKKVELQQVEEY